MKESHLKFSRFSNLYNTQLQIFQNQEEQFKAEKDDL